MNSDERDQARAAWDYAKNKTTLSAVARHFNITRQAVHQWDIVPPEKAMGVEQLTGVARHELRPDIYPDHGGSGRG